MQMLSPAQLLASLPEAEREAELARLSPDIRANLLHHWPFWARPNQLAPDGDWRTWLALAGRGFGKTEAGARWIKQRVDSGARSIALVGETQKDLEEVMVARLMKISQTGNIPTVRFRPVRLTWPNGAIALGYNGTEPDQLRGPEFDTAWVDELAKYRRARETWDMLQFTMRLGIDPRVFVTTTPRAIPLLREIMADGGTVITKGSTMDNAANLAPSFMKAIITRYGGTRLGRQELNAELLEDVPGALWTLATFDQERVDLVGAGSAVLRNGQIVEMQRIVVAVDPSGTKGVQPDSANGSGDDIGIVVAGKGIDGRAYVFDDATCNLSPDGWGRRAVERYHHWGADRVIGEVNYGGAMVEFVVRTADRGVAYKEVHASRGKSIRAEPIAALYEQGRVSHVGSFQEMEDQMIKFTASGYVGDGSPDRADALVWALTELMLGDGFDLETFLKANA